MVGVLWRDVASPKQSAMVQHGKYRQAFLTTSKLEKVVLARESHATFNKIVNPFSMMAVIQPTSQPYHFVVKFSEDEAFIGGTPERLFDMTMTDIGSDAIAGTIRNDAGGAKLLQRQKDASEHQYVSILFCRPCRDCVMGQLNLTRSEHCLNSAW